MINKLIRFTFTLSLALSLVAPQLSYGSPEESYDEEVVTPNLKVSELPPEILEMILIPVVSGGRSPWEIASVCKEWHDVIKDGMQEGNRVWDVWTGVKTPEDEETYRRFRDMELRYTDPNSGKEISLTIPDGLNPFKYTFDLSSCGDRNQDVVITNDLERFFTDEKENENKHMVCFVIKAWAKKNINSLASPFKDIMGSWDNVDDAPVGIFYRWGNRHSSAGFEYLISYSLGGAPGAHLFVYWKKRPTPASSASVAVFRRLGLLRFSCWFCEPKLEL